MRLLAPGARRSLPLPFRGQCLHTRASTRVPPQACLHKRGHVHARSSTAGTPIVVQSLSLSYVCLSVFLLPPTSLPRVSTHSCTQPQHAAPRTKAPGVLVRLVAPAAAVLTRSAALLAPRRTQAVLRHYRGYDVAGQHSRLGRVMAAVCALPQWEEVLSCGPGVGTKTITTTTHTWAPVTAAKLVRFYEQ